MNRRLKKAIAARVPPTGDGLRILLYHAITERGSSDPLGPDVGSVSFRQQMESLLREGYAICSVRELLDSGMDGVPRIVVTFDDGFRNQMAAAKILEELGATATFFVISDVLTGSDRGNFHGARWEFMDVQDALSLSERGFEVASHSRTHVDLSSIGAARVAEEIEGSKRILAEHLGVPVTSFSFPFGRFSRASLEVAEAAGYSAICTSRFGANRPPLASSYLRRIEIDGSDSLLDFSRKVHGSYDWLGRLHDVVHPARGWLRASISSRVKQRV